MTDQDQKREKKLLRQFRFKRAVAAFVLFTEKLCLHSWRILFWFLLFGGLWLMHIPALFGAAGAALALLGFVAGLGWLVYRDILSFRLPEKGEINRRLETDSNLRHRPVSSLEDRLANSAADPAQTLWQNGRRRLIKALAGLKNTAPHAFAARKDPYALRLAILLFFVTGLAVSGPGWSERIKNGLMPFTFSQGFKKASGINLWITPPEYTGLPRMILEGPGDPEKQLEVAAGSQVKIRITGGLGHPELIMGEQTRPLEYLGEDNYGLEITELESSRFEVRQMFRFDYPCPFMTITACAT